MARRLLAGVVLAAALVAVVPAAADQLPILRSAGVVDRHVVVELSVADLRPVQLIVSRRHAVGPGGVLLSKYVRLREAIQLPSSAATVIRWTSRSTFRPGVYFVQVKAVETGGVTDCPKFERNCLDHWSNVRRVVAT